MEKSSQMAVLVVTLSLVTFGIVMIYSSSSILAMDRYGDEYFFLKKQLFFAVVGVLLMFVLSNLKYENLRKAAYAGIIISIIFLVLILIPPIGVKRGGATRWLQLGFATFQVTEFVKIAMIVFLAHFLAKVATHIKDFKKGILIPLVVVAVVGGLVLLQPDFGTALIIAAIFMGMLYLAGARILYLSMMTVPLLAGAVVMVMMKPYRLQRWLAFLDPWKDAKNTGFQIIQSWISFGSGGPFGVGLGDGMQKLFYLPEPHTDFILSVVAEEAGFIGVAVVIVLFILLVFQGFVIAFRAADLFGTLLAGGLTMLIALEASINISAVVGLIPTKGLALPFMSYGGSSLVMSLAAVGILLSIQADRSKVRGNF
jgi:cell division protein FtsW